MVHYMWRADGLRTVAVDTEQRLALIRALLGVDVAVLSFCVVDNHVHALLESAPAPVRSAIGRALAACAGVDGEPARVKPVESRSHLQNLVRYHVDQAGHHALPDPAGLYDGSCFWDLVGARRLAGFDPARIRAHLPRTGSAGWFALAGLPDLAPVEVGGRALPELVVAARAAVGALGAGNARHEVAARRLAARAAAGAGFGTAAIAAALGADPRSVRRWAADPPAWGLRAVGLQLAIRDRCAARTERELQAGGGPVRSAGRAERGLHGPEG